MHALYDPSSLYIPRTSNFSLLQIYHNQKQYNYQFRPAQITKMPSSSSSTLTLLSQCTVYPSQKSTISDLKLSISDLAMLSCHYIQKGCLFSLPNSLPFHSLLPHLKSSLSKTLSHFPPLAGRLTTDSDGYVYITCTDAGVDFLHATTPGYSVHDLLSPPDVPGSFKHFFTFDKKVSYTGHVSPLLAVQVTELADGVFIGCSMNHAIADGTSFWNFFNTFAKITREDNEAIKISNVPDFRRDSILISKAVLRFPEGGPEVTFDPNEPLRERIFSFSKEAIKKLKATVNSEKLRINGDDNAVELIGKQSNDTYGVNVEISSFQSLCALLWRGVTRARKLPPSKTTAFKMAVNCRTRLEPKLDPYYFGNAIQSIPTYATAEDVECRGLRWCAEQLNKNVKAHDNAMVRQRVEDWEINPTCFPLGNPDHTSVTMGSSPRFPMYDNDFGWGRPVAVRSGGGNKFDGKISAFPGREGGGSVDLEVLLAPETMAGLESDPEFMEYASRCWCN